MNESVAAKHRRADLSKNLASDLVIADWLVK